MSFILNAVKKQQGQKTFTPTTHHQSVVSSNQNPSFIAWGILLTLAIFAALLAGFYLGQSQQSATVIRPNTVVNSPVITDKTQITQQSINQTDVHQPLKPVSTPITTNTQSTSNVEALFDGNVNLAVAVTQHNNEQTALHAKSQQPKVLGYQPEQAKLDDFSVDKSQLEGVSEELIAKFEQAIKETSESAVKDQSKAVKQPTQQYTEQFDINAVKPLTALDERFQQQVPKLIFSQHIYASNGKGLVQVNGEQAEQGSVLANGVKIVKIEPQQVILSYQNQLFSLSALAEWQ